MLALRVLYSHGGTIETQQKLYDELVDQLRWEREELRVSPGKMRQLLLSSKKIEVEVRYAMHALTRPVTACPVCRKPVLEIQNHTLDSKSVVTGYRCTSCAYWTPLRRRVPARYSFRVAE